MKMIKLLVLAFCVSITTKAGAQVFSGGQSGYPLIGRAGMFDGTYVTNSQAPVGNATGLTNFSGLVLTNSGANWLASGAGQTAPTMGFVTVQVVTTNAQVCILSNQTSGIGFSIGSLGGISTNYNDAQLFVNKNDSVLLTNSLGTPLLFSSYFQSLR